MTSESTLVGSEGGNDDGGGDIGDSEESGTCGGESDTSESGEDASDDGEVTDVDE